MTIYADIPVINLDTEIIIEYDTKKIYFRTTFKEYIYSYGKWEDAWGIDKIDTMNRTRDFVDKELEFRFIRGRYNDNLIVTRYDRENNIHSYYIYDPYTNRYTTLPELNINWDEKFKGIVSGSLNSLFYYKNGEYILNYRDKTMNYSVYIFNSITGKLNSLPIVGGKVVDISYDKMNILVAENHSGDVIVYNLEQKKVIAGVNSIYNREFDFACYFVTNNYIAISTINDDVVIYNIYGREMIRFIINPPKSNFSSSLMGSFQYSDYYLMGIVEGRTIKQKYVCKAESKLDVLDSFGLLFKSTTATANDSRVRIREWPLLDAKHLGYLTKGDKLEILDRSGIKVKIGDMEDYWYKLRRPSDGMEGWSYGAFIDLD